MTDSGGGYSLLQELDQRQPVFLAQPREHLLSASLAYQRLVALQHFLNLQQVVRLDFRRGIDRG